ATTTKAEAKTTTRAAEAKEGRTTTAAAKTTTRSAETKEGATTTTTTTAATIPTATTTTTATPAAISTKTTIKEPSANEYSTQQKSIPNQAPPVAIVPPTPQRTLPSLQITLRNDENERNVSSTINIPKTMSASAKPTNERASREQKHSFQSSTTILVGGGSRSAFRPFHKPT
ncbi:unnamed protein product, partial [Adineta steineri]